MGPKTKTLDELVSERSKLAREVAVLEQECLQVERSNASNLENLVVQDRRLLSIVRTHQDQSLSALGEKLTRARQNMRQLESQLAHVLEEQANIEYAAKRAECRAILQRMGQVCDQLDRAGYIGWDLWRELEDLYRAQHAIRAELNQAGASVGTDALLLPQHALKLVLLGIEQQAFIEAKKEAQSWGRWNPARATLRAAMRIPEKL